MEELEQIILHNDPSFEGAPVSSETLENIRIVLDRYTEDVEKVIDREEELSGLYESIGMKYLEIGRLEQRISEVLSGETAAPLGSLLDTGIFHEILAYGYFEKRIFFGALDNFERAIRIFPENSILYYYAGICAANIGKSLLGSDERENRASWLSRSEDYYRRVLELDPGNVNALIALSVLLIYEMDRSEDAEDLLERALRIETRNTDAMFMLASIFYGQRRYDEALSLYERIEDITEVVEKQIQAARNKERIVNELSETR